jgi:plasmid stability protein
MKASSTQITVRGLDSQTKSALAKQAAERGLSLNKYALEALKQAAGTDSSEERYQVMKQFLGKHRIAKTDKQAFDQAISWSDKASLEKQQRDERDAGL